VPEEITQGTVHVQEVTTHGTERMPDVTSVNLNLLPTADICKEDTDRRIHGGKIAGEEEYPWMALIYYTFKGMCRASSLNVYCHYIINFID